MEIEINENLKLLSKKFKKLGAKLYVVGGYVRDAILNEINQDIDVVSALTTDEIVSNFKDYEVNVINKKLGTVQIRKGKFMVEHTTFRIDYYKDGGEHLPYKVEFTKELEIDAYRRDFTCNSIYYDIENDKLIDFFGGVEDTKNKVLKAIVSPEFVFENDGLRLMRLVRFACYHNFSIDQETFIGAKEFNYQLDDISTNRIYKELEMILQCDNFMLALDYLQQLELFQYVFKDIVNLPLLRDFNNLQKDDFYYFLSKKTPKYLRIYAFLIDFILQVYKFIDTKQADLMSLARFILDYEYFACPKKIVDTVFNILMIIEEFDECKTENDLKALILDCGKDLEIIVDLFSGKEKYNDLIDLYEKLKSKNIAMNLSDFTIKGKEITNLGLTGRNVSLALNDMLLYGAVYEINDKEILIKTLKKLISEGKYKE